MTTTITVFRDLELVGPPSGKPALREALLAQATGSWSVDIERSRNVARKVAISDDLLIISRLGDGRVQDTSLTLVEEEGGYRVANIAPLAVGQLTHAEYNLVLQDFLEQVAAPAAEAASFSIRTTGGQQDLEDWMNEEAAGKLRRFSDCANKSNAASHPKDQERWFDFLIAVHASPTAPDAGRVVRWLSEIAGWDDDIAQRLGAKFENGLALLARYDRKQ